MSFTPQNDETNTPQNDGTNTPQNDGTNTPQNDGTNAPQNDGTSAPQNDDINESKLKEAKNSYTPQQIAVGCLVWLLLGVLLSFFIYSWFLAPKTIDLTTFLQLVKAEKVVEIEVKDNLVTTKKKDGKKVKTYIESNIGIYQQLKSAGIEVDTSK
ncbi:MAG: ATP-dependent metallopeptidase FtsH/Yme1/Tma family protein, partial [Trichodesmium sp. ALOHA_ZT_67]|nr:ATP-dependent metallopeptidase FtsH/Yme1/Tma family protein [Trichodesmium sp. ALOHA_ZT_67]